MDALVHPEQEDVCNTVDDDCNGTVDDNQPTWYRDVDEDGFGNSEQALSNCAQPAGYVSDSTDCDDAAAWVFPGATEVCDGDDNDCDGLSDLDDPDNTGLATWYIDGDGDGFGDSSGTQEACEAPSGFARTDDDCDDTVAAVNPDADDDCESGVDEDCDGLDQTCGITGVRDLADASAHFAAGEADVQATGVGDFDGDGFDDFLVQGSQASLFLGGTALILGEIPLISGAAEISTAGLGTGPIGDLDADGYSDFASGATLIYGQPGPTGVIDASTAGTTWIDAADAISGGDFDADGIQDLLMPVEGGWKVIKGNGARWSPEESAVPKLGLSITYGSLSVCDSVSISGDVDGDGIEDILGGWLVGPCGDPGVTGGVGVIHGGSGAGTQFETDGDALLTDPSSMMRPPTGVYLPDFDGDGYGDLAVTFMGVTAQTSIFYGGTAGIGSSTLKAGDTIIEELGTVAAPDVDGDGVTELFLAIDGLAIGFSGGTARGTYSRIDADTELAGSTPSTLASGGDVNGDGADDLVVGSADDGAWLLYGRP